MWDKGVKKTPVAHVIRLAGGLGNQFFQYAFGRSLALRLGGALLFDEASGFARDPYGRASALQRFTLCGNDRVRLCPPGFVRGQANLRWLRLVSRVQRLIPIVPGPTVYHERALFAYDPDVYFCKAPTYFIGYWQNLRYFDAESTAIRRELTLVEPVRPELGALAREMSETNSVAVHVRRYDLSDLKQFGVLRSDQITLDSSYYEQAVSRIERAHRDVSFYLFSDLPADDPPWLSGKRRRRIDSRSIQDDVAEHWLMSCCKHQVIANSTYSWWAAWLNANPRKRVIVPRKWFKGALSVEGIFPEGWEVLG